MEGKVRRTIIEFGGNKEKPSFSEQKTMIMPAHVDAESKPLIDFSYETKEQRELHERIESSVDSLSSGVFDSMDALKTALKGLKDVIKMHNDLAPNNRGEFIYAQEIKTVAVRVATQKQPLIFHLNNWGQGEFALESEDANLNMWLHTSR